VIAITEMKDMERKEVEEERLGWLGLGYIASIQPLRNTSLAALMVSFPEPLYCTQNPPLG
jgi:hypothetical protein